MRSFNLSRIFVVCLLMAGMAYAQGTGASGDIRGTVIDPSGAVMAKVNVTATDVGRGTKRTEVTDATGQYHFVGLIPSTYDITAQVSGFQTEIAKGVTVNVGQYLVLDFHMKVSQVAESVEVTTEAPVVDTERGHQANIISQEFISDLPINRRDYLTFTLLAPAVSDSTRLASDQDFRVKQTPQSGLSFYGSNGRGNSVTVDGGEANDDAGGVRLTLSQDGVQEFQINRSNYGAELGGASGGTINIVTKSGTNTVHGSLFGFFRNDAMDAANPFSFSQALQPGQTFNAANPDLFGTHVKDTLTRQQFGASIGFPITKDKTFFFGSFEGLMQDAQNSVPILTDTSIFRPDAGTFSGNNQQGIISALAAGGANPVPCILGSPSLPAAVCAGIINRALSIEPLVPGVSTLQQPLDNYLVNQLTANGGLFPYTTRQYQASGRLDHQFSERNQVFLRYSYAHDREESPDVQSLTGFSRGSSIAPAIDNTLQASWFHNFSPRTLNEARFQWNYSNFDVIPNTPGQAGLDIPGFASIGTQIFLPSLTIMRRYEFADNMSLIRGKHTMKLGAYFLYRGNHTESHTFFPGRFVFGNLPGFLVSPCLSVPAACANPANPNDPLFTLPPATINSLQSAGLGLPQFYQQGFGNPIYNYPRPFTAAYWQDSWTVKPNFTLNYGVRYELDAQYGALNTDKNNFAPRISFAWDPFKDQKTVIRGGYGIYYSPIYGQIADVVQTLGFVNGIRPIAQVFVPLAPPAGVTPPGVCPGNALTSACIFGNLFAQGKIQCTTAAAGQSACITPADLTQFGINITNVGPPPPLSVVFSGQPGYRNPYSQQAEFGIERQIGSRTSISVSGIYVHTIGLPVAIDTNALPTAPLRSIPLANGATATFRNWGAPQCGTNPFLCFANPLLLQTDQYSSKGSALYEGAILEIKRRFGNHLAIFGNYTFSKAFDTTTDFNSDFGPQDNTNLAAERGLSTFDQRHKVVVSGIVDTGTRGGILSGLQFSPIVRYNSGHPFNLLAGADVNGDRHSTNDRPIGVARNTGLGPDFVSFDARVTKRFRLTERSDLQLIAEGFNLLNRTNFASVNNVVSPNFLLPTALGGLGNLTANVHGSAALPPNAPLGFTSAFPMRQLQLGVRLAF